MFFHHHGILFAPVLMEKKNNAAKFNLIKSIKSNWGLDDMNTICGSRYINTAWFENHSLMQIQKFAWGQCIINHTATWLQHKIQML